MRLLNGSNARNYQFQLSDGSSFNQIASDGGFLNAPVSMNSLQLVPGERAEIIVDLSSYMKGETVQLMTDNIPVLTLKITEKTAAPAPSLPDTLNTIPSANRSGTAGKNPDKKLIFSGMGNMVTIDGKQFDMDRIDLTAKAGTKEIWEIANTPDMMGRMIHPFHIHGVQFKVLDRNGAIPPENERGWKDTPGESVQIEIEFPEKGIFMYHCHILEHEDNGMMGQILVE